MDSYITKVSLCIGMISNPYIKHIVNKNIKDTDKIYKNIWKISLSYFYLLICKNTEEGWNNEIMTTMQIFLPHLFNQWWYKDFRSSDKVANFSSGSAIIYGCMNIIFFLALKCFFISFMLNLSLESELKSLCIFIFVILIFNAYFDFIIECFIFLNIFIWSKWAYKQKSILVNFHIKA